MPSSTGAHIRELSKQHARKLKVAKAKQILLSLIWPYVLSKRLARHPQPSLDTGHRDKEAVPHYMVPHDKMEAPHDKQGPTHDKMAASHDKETLHPDQVTYNKVATPHDKVATSHPSTAALSHVQASASNSEDGIVLVKGVPFPTDNREKTLAVCSESANSNDSAGVVQPRSTSGRGRFSRCGKVQPVDSIALDQVMP